MVFSANGTTYGGGGLFISERRFMHCGGPLPADAVRSAGLEEVAWSPPPGPPPPHRELTLSHYHHRLLRAGWEVAGDGYRKTVAGQTLEKRILDAAEENRLAGRDGEPWEWAEFWRDEILYASLGALYRLGPRDGAARLVARFEPAVPSARAPDR